jgi:hypothetical protein
VLRCVQLEFCGPRAEHGPLESHDGRNTVPSGLNVHSSGRA